MKTDKDKDTLTNTTASTLTHYVGMNGTHGCMPDSCNAYETRDAAIEFLADLLELSDEQTQELKDFSTVECTQEQGADYCEVTACTCISPWEHSDDMNSQDNWHEYVKVHAQTFLETLAAHEYQERVTVHGPDCECPRYSYRCMARETRTLYVLPYATFGDYDNSSAVERSNAKVFSELPFVSQQFGDYGTVWTGIDASDIDAITWDQLQDLIDTCDGLADYPVIDEQVMSDVEMELQNEAWESWGRTDFQQELCKQITSEQENEEDKSALEDQIEQLTDKQIDKLFWHACEVSNTYWQIESGGNAYIDLERVAKAVVLADLDASEGEDK